MNKKLFEKVKGLCKDTGLSEKYLKAITEKMGGSIEDDSTDEAAIETAANLVADVAKESQGEATRWVEVSKQKNPKPKPGEEKHNEPESEPKPKPGDPKPDGVMQKLLDKMTALETKVADMEKGKAKADRSKTISELMAKNKIPKYLQDRLAKSIGDDEDAEAIITGMKQDLITNGLTSDDSEGSKAASAKAVDEAADSLLESITVKDKTR